MNADTVESFARLAGTLALLATYKFGRGGGFDRVRQRFSRAVASATRRPRATGEKTSSGPQRPRHEISPLMVALWVALLLLIVGYAALRGESALSDLDEVRLIADF
jgi:hypothetical protein